MHSVHRADTVAVECIPSPATMVILTPRYTRILHAVYCGIVRAAERGTYRVSIFWGEI